MWHDATHSYMTRTLDIWWVVSWHRWVVPCHMWPASSLARGTSTRDTVCHVSHKCYMTWVIFHTRHPMTSSIDESCHVWQLMSRDSTRDDVFAWLIHVGRLIHGDMTSYHSCMGRLMWSDTTRDDSCEVTPHEMTHTHGGDRTSNFLRMQIFNKFSRESTRPSNKFSRVSQKNQTILHGSKRECPLFTLFTRVAGKTGQSGDPNTFSLISSGSGLTWVIDIWRLIQRHSYTHSCVSWDDSSYDIIYGWVVSGIMTHTVTLLQRLIHVTYHSRRLLHVMRSRIQSHHSFVDHGRSKLFGRHFSRQVMWWMTRQSLVYHNAPWKCYTSETHQIKDTQIPWNLAIKIQIQNSVEFEFESRKLSFLMWRIFGV